MQSASLTTASITGFSGVYVFGDSLVDPGNALKAAKFLDSLPFTSTPDRAPTADKGYFEGRFSDGYNFADLVSNKLIGAVTKTTFPYGFEDPLLGIPITVGGKPGGNNLSFAYGGAQAIRGDEPVPDLDEQTDAYRNYPGGDPNALYIVTIGGNDIRELVPRSSAPVVGAAATAKLTAIAVEIADEVKQLYSFGVRHVLVTGMPDVGLIPYYSGAADEALKRGLASQYADQLDGLVSKQLGAIPLPAGARLYDYSLQGFSDAVLANPAAFNLTNLTQARTVVQAGALAPVGSGFLFFDDVHPSAQVHALVAADILELFGAAPDHAVATQAGPRTFAAIETAAGHDDFTTSLVAGRSYSFDVLGVSSGSGALPDPRLQLLNAGGVVIASDDDGGLGLDAHLAFTPSVSGAYTLRIEGVGVARGSYIAQGPDLRGSGVRVEGGALNDTLGALSGANTLRGGDGADSLAGGTGFDDINGDAGNDTAAGGLGDDWVLGGVGDDRLSGGGGNDKLNGNLGNDVVIGDDGNDTLMGGQGGDLLQGGVGADYLSGDLGNDTLAGGSGADIFHTAAAMGIDRIVDFHLAEGDRVQVDPGTAYSLSQVGADAVISFAAGGQMILAGVSTTSLVGSWIIGA